MAVLTVSDHSTGRTYAMDCYLKLLVRLCHIYDTVGGVKKAKDGASPEQIVAETRLQALQSQLVKDLSEVQSTYFCFISCHSFHMHKRPRLFNEDALLQWTFKGINEADFTLPSFLNAVSCRLPT